MDRSILRSQRSGSWSVFLKKQWDTWEKVEGTATLFGLIYAPFYKFKRMEKRGDGEERGRPVTFIHPHLFEGLLQMQMFPLQKIFIATLHSPLRAHEDAKSSNTRKSVQVLHLFPFISLCSSPVGVYRIKIFVGVLLFSLLLSTLSLLPHFLPSPSVVWAISAATRTR